MPSTTTTNTNHNTEQIQVGSTHTNVERLWRLFSEQVEALFDSWTVIRRSQVFVAFA